MQKIEQTLGKLGFTEQETAVYRLLLEKGSSLSVSDISSASGLYRPAVYLAVGALLDRQVITQVAQGKRKEYIAEPPSKLRGMIREISIDVEEVIPDLDDIYKAPKEKPQVRVIEGTKGFTFVFEDVVSTLKKGDILYRYSSRTGEENTKYLPKDYFKRRDAIGFERMVITSSRLASQKKPDINRTVKIISSEQSPFGQNILFVIYANKVVTIDLVKWSTIIIENEQFADFQKSIFKLLFKSL